MAKKDVKETPEEPGASDDVQETDIVFNCEHCGQSLAMERDCAGITLPCPECHKDIVVPLPSTGQANSSAGNTDEEPPIDDFSIEEALSRIAELENELSLKNEQIKTLMTELEELRFRRTYLEKARSENSRMFLNISSQLSVLQSSIEQLNDILNATEQDASETQIIAQ